MSTENASSITCENSSSPSYTIAGGASNHRDVPFGVDYDNYQHSELPGSSIRLIATGIEDGVLTQKEKDLYDEDDDVDQPYYLLYRTWREEAERLKEGQVSEGSRLKREIELLGGDHIRLIEDLRLSKKKEDFLSTEVKYLRLRMGLLKDSNEDLKKRLVWYELEERPKPSLDEQIASEMKKVRWTTPLTVTAVDKLPRIDCECGSVFYPFDFAIESNPPAYKCGICGKLHYKKE